MELYNPTVGATPATQAPPAIGDANAMGTSTRFAREDHTHKTSIQRKVVTTDANGLASWTFPTAYAATPVVQLTIESTGAFCAPDIQAISATAITVKIQKLAPVLGVLGITTAGAGVKVHINAGKETT